MRLKKIDAKIDIEKRLLPESKTLREKGPETKVEKGEKPTGNPGKSPVKSPEKSTKKPHEKLVKEAVVAPPALTVRSPVRTLSPIRPVRTTVTFLVTTLISPIKSCITHSGRTSSNGDSRRN